MLPPSDVGDARARFWRGLICIKIAGDARQLLSEHLKTAMAIADDQFVCGHPAVASVPPRDVRKIYANEVANSSEMASQRMRPRHKGCACIKCMVTHYVKK